MTYTMVDLERAGKIAVEDWADEFLPAGYRAKGVIQWNSDEEVYLVAHVYKGRKHVGNVVTTVPTLAWMNDAIAEGLPDGPGDHQDNVVQAYRWLLSDGDMGHSPSERLQEAAQEDNTFGFPKDFEFARRL